MENFLFIVGGIIFGIIIKVIYSFTKKKKTLKILEQKAQKTYKKIYTQYKFNGKKYSFESTKFFDVFFFEHGIYLILWSSFSINGFYLFFEQDKDNILKNEKNIGRYNIIEYKIDENRIYIKIEKREFILNIN